jgi:hypothetical protein
MVITNKKKVTRLKRLFVQVSLVLAILILILFLIDQNLYAILTGAAIMVWFFVFQLFDFQFVEFISDNGKIILRYYPAVTFGRKDYSAIEFTQDMLYDAKFDNSFFGLITDLTLIVKTKRGVAEYPSVSLTAVNSDNRKKIIDEINRILDKKDSIVPLQPFT